MSIPVYPNFPAFPDEAFDVLKKANSLDPTDVAKVVEQIKKLQEQERILVERKKMRNYSDVNAENTIQRIENLELELKHKELTALAINLVDKNEFLMKLKEQAEEIGKAKPTEVGGAASGANRD